MNVGFIGLGDMGQAIVPRLLEAGHRVRVGIAPKKKRSHCSTGHALGGFPATACVRFGRCVFDRDGFGGCKGCGTRRKRARSRDCARMAFIWT